MKNREIKQGDIYMGSLPTGIDSETKGCHPLLILSVDLRNEKSGNVVVASITHRQKKYQPTHYYLYKYIYPNFIYDVNTVMLEDIHTISKRRLQGFLLHLKEKDMNNILELTDYIFIEKVK